MIFNFNKHFFFNKPVFYLLQKGLFCREFKQMYQLGFQDYLIAWSNMFTLTMGSLYAASYALKFYTVIRVSNELISLDHDEFWETVETLNSTDLGAQIDVYQTFYWLNNGKRF
jgi:hypothetical protein